MKFEDLVATPGQPVVRLRIGPEEVIEVDQLFLDANKAELKDILHSIPNAEGMTWRDMKQYTHGNGMMAKLLISLGDLLGVWVMHPPRFGDIPWNRDHPRILQSFSHKIDERKEGVTKPSAGDLERDTVPCVCCGRDMGPSTSAIHDLQALEGSSGMCIECAVEGCDPPHCNLFPEKAASLSREVGQVEEPGFWSMEPSSEGEDVNPGGTPGDLESYLRSFE